MQSSILNRPLSTPKTLKKYESTDTLSASKDLTPDDRYSPKAMDAFEAKEMPQPDSEIKANPTLQAPSVVRRDSDDARKPIVPALDETVGFVAQDATSNQSFLGALPLEVKLAIIASLNPDKIHPMDILALSGVNKDFHNIIANEASIWGENAVKQSNETVTTAQHEWVIQFKTLKKETQYAIIVTKSPVDIFSEESIKIFEVAIEPAMEAFERAKKAASVFAMEEYLQKAAGLAEKAGVPAPVLSPEEVKTKYITFMHEAFERAKKAASVFAMEEYLQKAAGLAEKAGVPAPVLSPEEVKTKYITFMHEAFERAKKAASVFAMEEYLQKAAGLAEKAGVPAPVLSPEEVKTKYITFMHEAFERAKKATSVFAMEEYLQKAAGLAEKAGVPAPVLSPEKMK